MTAKEFMREFIILFIVVYLLSLLLSYLYTVLVYDIGIIDYSLSLRLGLLFGIVLPLHRLLVKNK